MKTLVLEERQIFAIKDAIYMALASTKTAYLKGQYIAAKMNIEQQTKEIDKSNPQEVWNTLKNEINVVSELWKEKIYDLIPEIDDHNAQSKVSFMIDKITDLTELMNDIENNL